MAEKRNKGILWGIVFFITAIIYYTIPTYLIFTYWIWLNELIDLEGNPIYTFALLALFTYFVTLLVALIYSVATVRAIVQRKNEEGLGIPKGVKWFGFISTMIVVSLMIIWYFLFNEIAIFTLTPP
ncbi:unnamed protein product [marine sediment metagenome]|uniref:Uncharacterized protein n=1 Tax=marine sediment metagenome TaxID=412755 RepID=X1BE09_9ZZZZ